VKLKSTLVILGLSLLTRTHLALLTSFVLKVSKGTA